MTDRELLALAAKAYGDGVHWCGDRQLFIRPVPWRNYVNDEDWNPLVDDGDALRLAVKLGIHIGFYGDHVAAERTGGKLKTEQRRDGDVKAATRRCIVRAAAEAAELQAPGAAPGDATC